MLFQYIEMLLTTHIGLNVESIGKASVKGAVAWRMSQLRMEDLACYKTLLLSSEEELQELIDAVTIPETWFFRDQKPFDYLVEHIQQRWLFRKLKRRLRVLSIPCATGEEAYSIAIMLHSVGMSIADYEIEAIDVSKSALEKAIKGVYSANVLRATDQNIINEYFTTERDDYRLQDWIKAPVTFAIGNALELRNSCHYRNYDVIFCRNLLIYFDKNRQRKVIEQIAELLCDDGLLFVGHAETGSAVNHYFKSAGKPSAFAFIKREAESDTTQHADDEIINVHEVMAAKQGEEQKYPRNSTGTIYAKASRNAAELGKLSTVIVTEIENLANKGLLDEASVKCELALQGQNVDAKLLYVCGIVKETQGDQCSADELIARAIDSDPSNTHVLAHFAASLDAQGKIEEANRLRQRAENVSRVNEERLMSK